MPLSCSCAFDPYDDGAWFYDSPDDYQPLDRPRAVRCASCKALIKPGDTTIQFTRWRGVTSDIEARFYGDDGEVPLGPMFHCEVCADLYFSLAELGFECIAPDENMRELVQEYAELQDHPPLISRAAPDPTTLTHTH
jgi:hypothetical protein